MNDVVTDVFAFACSDAEWSDLLDADADLPPDVLAEADQEAFDAARTHVQDCVEALVRSCLLQFRIKAPKNDARYRALIQAPFRRTDVRRLWYFGAKLGTKGGHSLMITVEQAWDDDSMKLFGSIHGPQQAADALEAAFPTRPPATKREANVYYFGSLAIREGDRFEDLAVRLVESGWDVVKTYVDLIEPRSGRQANKQK